MIISSIKNFIVVCTYCPSPPGKGVSRHIVGVGELASRVTLSVKGGPKRYTRTTAITS